MDFDFFVSGPQKFHETLVAEKNLLFVNSKYNYPLTKGLQQLSEKIGVDVALFVGSALQFCILNFRVYYFLGV